MKIYAIRNKETGKLIRFEYYCEVDSPKFYGKIRFAKSAITSHGKSLNKYEIVEYELTNEKVINE